MRRPSVTGPQFRQARETHPARVSRAPGHHTRALRGEDVCRDTFAAAARESLPHKTRRNYGMK